MPNSNSNSQEPTRTRIRPWLAPVSLGQTTATSTNQPASSSATSNTTPSTSTSSFQEDLLRLQVLDVTSTAVALSVFTPQSASSSPSISIQLNGEPWPHVAHALAMGGSGNETTVIVYGLEQGKEFEIGLDVVGRDEDGELLNQEAEHEGDVSRQSDEIDPSTSTLDHHPHTTTTSTTIHATTLSSNDAPPPYSPSSPLPPTEPQLRALLKKLRANSKRTESVLNSSISSLKKTVEKGIKEDQRARSRIVSLEDGIRKANETEVNMRGTEMDSVLESITELEASEKEVREELEGRKSGKIASTVVKEKEKEKEREREKEKEHEDEKEEDLPGIAELAKELDGINKQIDFLENEKRKKVKDVLRGLEVELGQIEGELIAMDREEQHRYNIAARMSMSNDSLPHPHHPHVHPHPHPPQQPQPSSSNLVNSFNLKWGRNRPPNANVPQASTSNAAGTSPNTRSFGQFFRRSQQGQAAGGGNDYGGMPHISAPVYGSGAFLPPAVAARQQFAQEQQAQALWGLNNGSSGKLISGLGLGNPSRTSLDLSLSKSTSLGDGTGGGRPRATSLNSAARPFVAGSSTSPAPVEEGSTTQPPYTKLHPRGVSSPIPIVGALPNSPSDTSSMLPNPSPVSTVESQLAVSEGGGGSKKKKKGKGKDKEDGLVRPGSSSSSKESGASWGRIGTWSQVVGRGGKKKGEKEEEGAVKEEEKEKDSEVTNATATTTDN